MSGSTTSGDMGGSDHCHSIEGMFVTKRGGGGEQAFLTYKNILDK